MEGLLHAVLLVVVVVASAWLCYRRGRAPEVVASLYLLAFAGYALVHLVIDPALKDTVRCDVGYWSALWGREWPVFGICLALMLYCVPELRRRVGTYVGFVAVVALFSLHLAQLDRLGYPVYAVPPGATASARVLAPSGQSWLTGVWRQPIRTWHPTVQMVIQRAGDDRSAVTVTPSAPDNETRVRAVLARWVGERVLGDTSLQGGLNLALVLPVPLTTLGILLGVRRRPPLPVVMRTRATLSAVGIFLLLAVPCCHALTVVLGMGVIGVAVLAWRFAGQPRAQLVGMLAVTLLSMIALTHVYYLQNGFIPGKPLFYSRSRQSISFQGRAPLSRKVFVAAVQADLRTNITDQSQSFPAGWLADEVTLREASQQPTTVYLSPHPVWYSDLTGLSPQRSEALWYPGGPLSAGINGIRLRPYTGP